MWGVVRTNVGLDWSKEERTPKKAGNSVRLPNKKDKATNLIFTPKDLPWGTALTVSSFAGNNKKRRGGKVAAEPDAKEENPEGGGQELPPKNVG